MGGHGAKQTRGTRWGFAHGSQRGRGCPVVEEGNADLMQASAFVGNCPHHPCLRPGYRPSWELFRSLARSCFPFPTVKRGT